MSQKDEISIDKIRIEENNNNLLKIIRAKYEKVFVRRGVYKKLLYVILVLVLLLLTLCLAICSLSRKHQNSVILLNESLYKHHDDHTSIYTEISKLNDHLNHIRHSDKSFTSSLVIMLKENLQKLQTKREEVANLKRSYENAVDSYHMLMDRYMKLMQGCKSQEDETRRNLTEKSFIIETLSMENSEAVKNVTWSTWRIEELENLNKIQKEELESLQKSIEGLFDEEQDLEDRHKSSDMSEDESKRSEDHSQEATESSKRHKLEKKMKKAKNSKKNHKSLDTDDETEPKKSFKFDKKSLKSIKDYIETVKEMGQELEKCEESKEELDECQSKITQVYRMYTTDDLESAIVKTSLVGDMKSDLLEWLTNLLNKHTNLDEPTRDYNSICAEISEKMGYKYFHTAYWNCFVSKMGYYVYYDDYYAVFDFENDEDLIIFNVPKQSNCTLGLSHTTTKHPVIDGSDVYR